MTVGQLTIELHNVFVANGPQCFNFCLCQSMVMVSVNVLIFVIVGIVGILLIFVHVDIVHIHFGGCPQMLHCYSFIVGYVNAINLTGCSAPNHICGNEGLSQQIFGDLGVWCWRVCGERNNP